MFGYSNCAFFLCGWIFAQFKVRHCSKRVFCGATQSQYSLLRTPRSLRRSHPKMLLAESERNFPCPQNIMNNGDTTESRVERLVATRAAGALTFWLSRG